ncbi:dihydroxy-acid dehydratase, partial [Gammaproteobacteria bacterium]|nr:dihydroxy-acid dehydratase [Gammaproteobacteria bacterium]
IKIDLNKCTVDIMISVTELDKRKKLLPKERFLYPESQTPWQEIFREKVLPFSEGMTIDGASKYQDIARKHIPRDNH